MISCNDYDYIEIVCMPMPIKLTLKSGEQIECVKLDLNAMIAVKSALKVSIQGVRTTCRTH